MTGKVYVVTDLGPGDGGKGGVVHKIAAMTRAHTIIKRGGAQGSHGVCTSRGERFAFSQWGCGTFEGVRTHLSQQMVISPEGLLNEADALRYGHGIHNPFDLLTVDRRALCATPFHGIASRLKEMARGTNPRGTIGTGVGEAYRDFGRYPQLAIRAGDISRPDAAELLAAAREQVRHDLQPIIEGGFLAADQVAAERETALLYDDKFLDYVVGRFAEAGKRTQIVGPAFMGDKILLHDGTAVVESSHGVLTDRLLGFHPHTSAIRTLPEFTANMLDEAGFGGQVVNIGVTRAYAIRHGAGPMPTANPGMAESLLPGSHKDENRYQGKVRVGPLDLVLLRYAIEASGGHKAFDGLAITWFDQIVTNQTWHICNHYSDADDPAYFSPEGEIKVRRGTGPEQLEHQAALGQKLQACRPEINSKEVPSTTSSEELYALCASTIEEMVGVPVRMVSFGPTEKDKLCK
jgi:adenylosuccinate synthase